MANTNANAWYLPEVASGEATIRYLENLYEDMKNNVPGTFNTIKTVVNQFTKNNVSKITQLNNILEMCENSYTENIGIRENIYIDLIKDNLFIAKSQIKRADLIYMRAGILEIPRYVQIINEEINAGNGIKKSKNIKEIASILGKIFRTSFEEYLELTTLFLTKSSNIDSSLMRDITKLFWQHYENYIEMIKSRIIDNIKINEEIKFKQLDCFLQEQKSIMLLFENKGISIVSFYARNQLDLIYIYFKEKDKIEKEEYLNIVKNTLNQVVDLGYKVEGVAKDIENFLMVALIQQEKDKIKDTIKDIIKDKIQAHYNMLDKVIGKGFAKETKIYFDMHECLKKILPENEDRAKIDKLQQEFAYMQSATDLLKSFNDYKNNTEDEILKILFWDNLFDYLRIINKSEQYEKKLYSEEAFKYIKSLIEIIISEVYFYCIKNIYDTENKITNKHEKYFFRNITAILQIEQSRLIDYKQIQKNKKILNEVKKDLEKDLYYKEINTYIVYIVEKIYFDNIMIDYSVNIEKGIQQDKLSLQECKKLAYIYATSSTSDYNRRLILDLFKTYRDALINNSSKGSKEEIKEDISVFINFKDKLEIDLNKEDLKEIYNEEFENIYNKLYNTDSYVEQMEQLTNAFTDAPENTEEIVSLTTKFRILRNREAQQNAQRQLASKTDKQTDKENIR